MDDNRIVDWAPYGVYIPLVCKVCGSVFNTKNIGYIGARSLFFGYCGERIIETKKCEACDNAGHKISDLEPSRDIFENKEAYIEKIAAGYKTYQREKEMDKVLNNIKEVWKTNPEISLGDVLALIEANTNISIYALRDEDIIKLTEKMDVSDITEEDINEL